MIFDIVAPNLKTLLWGSQDIGLGSPLISVSISMKIKWYTRLIKSGLIQSEPLKGSGNFVVAIKREQD